MPRGREKRPRSIVQVGPGKGVVRPTEATDFRKLRPAWRFSSMRMEGWLGWRAVSAGELEQVRRKLVELERLTWGEILEQSFTGKGGKRKSKHHHVPFWKFPKATQDAVGEALREEITELCSLRLQGRQRVYGIRENNVLRLLFWDPRHEAYPTGKG